jgi:hypothetical protein
MVLRTKKKTVEMQNKLESMGCNCAVRFASKATSSDEEWLSHFVRYILESNNHSNDCKYRVENNGAIV